MSSCFFLNCLGCPRFYNLSTIYISHHTAPCFLCPCVCVCMFVAVMVLCCPGLCKIFNSICSLSPPCASTLPSCDNKNKKLQICQLFSGGKKAEVPEQELLVYTDHIFLKILCKCPPSLYLRRYICTIRPTTLVDHSDDHLDRVIAWLPLLQHWTVERTFDFSPEDLMSKVRFPNIQIVESSWKSINHLM